MMPTYVGRIFVQLPAYKNCLVEIKKRI